MCYFYSLEGEAHNPFPEDFFLERVILGNPPSIQHFE